MNRIKRARLVAGLTQDELAKKLSVSNVAICRWENGLNFPRPSRLKLIAKTLHIPVEELIEEAG